MVSDAAGKPRDTEPRSASMRDLGRRALEVESNSVLVATIALIVFIGILHPDFLAWGQLKEVVQNSAYVGIIAAGMAFLISMREIDLSVGSMFGLALVISALLMQHGMNPWLAALLGVLLGCAMGLFNAILVQFIAIPAIVATLATLSMYRGLSQALSDGEQVTGLPAEQLVLHVLRRRLRRAAGERLGADPRRDRPDRGAALHALRLPRAGDRLQPRGGDVLGHLDPARPCADTRARRRPRGPLGHARARVLHLGRPQHRHGVRAAGDRRGGDRRHAVARRQRDGGRRRAGLDPAERRQQRARLLQRAGQLEQRSRPVQ